MPQSEVDLASVFQAVTQTLADNQKNLDQADEYNRDHGTNMVKTFKTITTALEKKKGSSDSEALQYAARQLSRKATSGSAKLYAQNLNQAATRLQGKPVDERGAMELLQSLIGGGQAAAQPSQPATAPGGGDLLGALLGSMAGGESSSSQPAGGDLLGSLLGGMAGVESSSNQSAGGDLLGALLGGMAGGESSSNQSAGGDLLGALLGGLSGSGGSGNLLGTLAQAFLGSSNMGQTTHRNQSTLLVIQAFLKALSALRNK
jgi:hypothetical protein